MEEGGEEVWCRWFQIMIKLPSMGLDLIMFIVHRSSNFINVPIIVQLLSSEYVVD